MSRSGRRVTVDDYLQAAVSPPGPWLMAEEMSVNEDDAGELWHQLGWFDLGDGMAALPSSSVLPPLESAPAEALALRTEHIPQEHIPPQEFHARLMRGVDDGTYAQDNLRAATDMQEALDRRPELVGMGLIPELTNIRIPPGAGRDVQFLDNTKRSDQAATVTVPGPKSGYLWAGNPAKPMRAMLKLNGSLKEGHPPATIAVWREVELLKALPDGKSKKNPDKDVDFKELPVKVSIVTQVPDPPMQSSKRPRTESSVGDEPSAAGAPSSPPQQIVQMPPTGAPEDQRFGRVEVEALSIKGHDVWKELMEQRERMQQLESSSKSAPLPTTSHRADLAEWMETLEDVRCGDVGEVRGERFSRKITREPGGTIFVVSSKPALAFNMPEEPERRAQGAVLAFIGRVPVFCIGDAAVDSYLVPSGRNDGSARAVSCEELQRNATLRAQSFGVIWALLPPDAEDGRTMVLAFVCAHPLQSLGSMRNVFKVASVGSTLVPQPSSSGCNLRPRAYQAECIEVSKERNTVVCLDTGLGKTLIAVKLIDHFLRTSPTKKILFIVPTVILVEQQARVCREQSGRSLRVVELCGNRLEGWTNASWDKCVESSDVMVGTPAIFVTGLVTHGYLNISQFALIIFDEVHNAVGNSPMANVMNDAYHPSKRDGHPVPRIVGLTASFVAGAIDNLNVKRKTLEQLSDAQIFAPTVPDEFLVPPTFSCISYPADTLSNFVELARTKVRAGQASTNPSALLSSQPPVVNRIESSG